MKRGGPIKQDPDKIRAWQQRSRKPLPQKSARRKAEKPTRDAVRSAAIRRANGTCEYHDVIPEVVCAFYAGRGWEVDELRGGSYRSTEYLDVDRVRVTCPAHHDHKTANKREVLRRLEEMD